MNYIKQRKLAEKLFKDILKHGDKNIDKFLKKGLTPENLLDIWVRASLKDKDAFDSEILYSLFRKTDIISAIKEGSLYVYPLLTRFVKEKSSQEILQMAADLKIQPLMLDVLTSQFAMANGVGHNNINMANKYAGAIKTLASGMKTVPIDALDDIVAFADKIPFGDKDYPNRRALMDMTLDLCKTFCAKLDKSDIRGAGSLQKFVSPIVENDDVSIEFIGQVTKILMDTGFDLYADDFVMEDSICRKDFSGKLQRDLESYYHQKSQEKLGQAAKSKGNSMER